MAAGAEWQRRVARWRASGEPASVFATKAGLNPRTLKWWASRLRRGRDRRGEAVELVRVVAAPAARPVASPVEIVLAGGTVVRVSSGFDAGVLRAVVAALEQGA